MRFVLGLVLVTVAGLSAPITARAENLICTITTSDSNGWLPRTALFFLDAERKSAAVLNEITLSKSREPLKARFKLRRDGTYQVDWNVPRLGTSQGPRVTARYFAVFNADRTSVNIKARIASAINAPSGTGGCAILDQKTLDQLKSRG